MLKGLESFCEARFNNLRRFYMNDPRVWVEKWFKDRNVQVLSWNNITIDNKETHIDYLINEMHSDFITYKPKKLD